MSIQTRTITATISDLDGPPLPNARVVIELKGLGNSPQGAVAPGRVEQLTNADGIATFQLWQNSLEYSDTYYEISSWHPQTGKPIHQRETFIVGSTNADVKDLINVATVPIDATAALLSQVLNARAATEQAASDAQGYKNEANTYRIEAGESSATATAQAGIATTAAGTATTQAGIATDAAALATTQAGAAATHAGIAEGHASNAEGFATAAEGQAGIAEGHANDASGFASQASTFATQASGHASNALEQAGIAESHAEDAQGFALIASGHAADAQGYAQDAAGYETGAATQAGIATTQAGIASTQANEAGTQAENALSHAETAQRWATEAEDVPVASGSFSAFHWAKKAEALVSEATEGAVLSVNGKSGPAVTLTAEDVGAASAAQGTKADTAIQPAGLTTILADYVHNTALANYVTSSTLTLALDNFYTKTEADARYATAAQGSLANTALQPNDPVIRRIRTLALAGI